MGGLLDALLQRTLFRAQRFRRCPAPRLLLEPLLFARKLDHLLDGAIELGRQLFLPFRNLLLPRLRKLARRVVHRRRCLTSSVFHGLVTALLRSRLLRTLLLRALLLSPLLTTLLLTALLLRLTLSPATTLLALLLLPLLALPSLLGLAALPPLLRLASLALLVLLLALRRLLRTVACLRLFALLRILRGALHRFG